MRKSLLVLLLAAWGCSALGARGQNQTPTAFDLDEFLSRYESGLKPLDQLYAELANESLPLRDEAGLPLARRHIEDRRQALNDLRASASQLAANPQDLVLATRMFVQGEAMADDLFGLSQVAYDNSREELGRQFADLLRIIDRHNLLLESYVLRVAAEKETRLRELEKENQELRQKLREAAEPSKPKPPA